VVGGHGKLTGYGSPSDKAQMDEMRKWVLPDRMSWIGGGTAADNSFVVRAGRT